MNPGDPIWYRHAQRGGYAFAVDVPGEFVRVTARRVAVRLLKKDGTSVVVRVSADNVRPRDPETVWR